MDLDVIVTRLNFNARQCKGSCKQARSLVCKKAVPKEAVSEVEEALPKIEAVQH